MPTYTYRCQKCGEEIEVVQAMSDPPLKRCRSCRGALKRTFHPVGIVLKGSGFYKTDYGGSRNRSEKRESSSEGSAKSSTKDDKGSKDTPKDKKPSTNTE